MTGALHRRGSRRGRLLGAVAAAVLGLVLVGGLALGALVAYDLLEVRRDLTAAHERLRAVGSSLEDVDPGQATVALDAAEADLRRAGERTTSLRWTLAGWVPVVRHPVVVTRDVVATASAAVEVVRAGADGTAGLWRDGVPLTVADGRVDLAPLLAARDALDDLPLARLEAAHAALAQPPGGWVPDALAEGRRETLALAGTLLGTARRGRSLGAALPGFLGSDEPRRHLVGMQTSAELRATGGLIGYWTVVEVDDGHVHVTGSEVFEGTDEVEPDGEASTIARAGTLRGARHDGAGAPRDFLDRYGRFAADATFSNVNLDPDLPTTAEVMLDLFELRTGTALDGVVLLDPVGLERLLEASGSTLPVPDDLAEVLGLDGEVSTDRFAELVSVRIYEVLGSDHGAERKAALATLGDAAIGQLLAGGWDGAEMVGAVAAASRDRHLQVFSRDADEQAAFVELGVAGAFDPPEDADLLAVIANNAVGGKQDVHVGHRIDVQVALTDVLRDPDGTLTADRRATTRVEVDNPLPTDGMDEYVIGNCVRDDGTVRCFEGPPGWNRTWFSVWLPATSQVVAGRADDGGGLGSVGTYRGFQVADRWHATPPEDTSGFEVEAVGRVPVQVTGSAVVYELNWRRQPKAIPDLLDVTVDPPEGWQITDVEVEGAGSGRGLGVHGDGVGLVAGREGASGRVRGTVTADTRIRVHLGAAER